MQMIATELSPQQIAALASYYSALPRRATETAPDAAKAPAPAAGQQIALAGLPAVGLAPCAGCHGVTRAADKAYPLIEGQAQWYIANQMRVFRSGGRGGIGGNNPDDPMVAIARKLDDSQIAAVAAYYAAQPPALVQSFAAAKPAP